MARQVDSSRPGAARRYRRIALWCLFAMLASSMLLPLTGYVWVGYQEATAQAVKDKNPRAEYWRAVREGNQGYTAVTGDEANVLINNGGQNWRQLRNGLVANWGGWVLFAVVVAVAAFFVWRGRIPIEGGRSGRTVPRWNGFERFVHWTTAVAFVILGATGLSLLFGRAVLIPVLGPKGFAVWADISMELHNFLGPFVLLPGVVLMLAMWVWNNIPNAEDLEWFKQGGGIFGKKHPHAGKANAGEKVWFWFIMIAGGAVIVSGLFLVFPNWGTTRDGMQLANLIHGGVGLAWIAMWIGHAYIGTLGTEGALEGMTTGRVDVNWAKQHHDRWYAQVEGESSEAGEDDPTVVKGTPA